MCESNQSGDGSYYLRAHLPSAGYHVHNFDAFFTSKELGSGLFSFILDAIFGLVSLRDVYSSVELI